MTLHPSARRKAIGAAAAFLVATSLVACGAESGASPSGSAGALEVTGAWARTSPAVVTSGAVYLEIANDGEAADALISASVDPTVAAMVELHETVESGGMMEMQPVDEIPIPAGGSVSLEPGDYHIMLKDLATPLEMGTTIEITLVFEVAGEQVVTAEVRDTAP